MIFTRFRFLILLFLTTNLVVYSQSTNDILNILVANKTLTQEQADSLRADAAIKQQEADVNKKSFLPTSGRQIQISGYTQVRYQEFDEPGKINTADIRRARLAIKGNISPYFGYGFQADFASSPKLLDAYIDCKLSEYFVITAGQFKLPFSYENLTSSNKMEMIDRSQAVEALVFRGKDVNGNQNGRDIGIQIGGTLLKLNDRSVIDYRAGLFNGQGINTVDLNESKDFVGRLIFHPIKGLDFGGSYLNGLGNYAVTKASPAIDHRKNRYGLEVSYELKNFSFRSEYLRGEDNKAVREGWYAQAGYYIIPQKLQFLFKYDKYNPSISTLGDISILYTTCLNYNFNSYSRIQLAYIFRQEQGPKINNNIGQVQYQIGF
jgi:phosphate-selective porin OprO and OprP